MAIENDHIRADMVEVTEFPHLANKYGVMGVPMTIVNDVPAIEGASPEARFVDDVLAAAGAGKKVS
jgi:predicted DsbA family dithiol-disulfide isomerase